jgi:hypothetical protein
MPNSYLLQLNGVAITANSSIRRPSHGPPQNTISANRNEGIPIVPPPPPPVNCPGRPPLLSKPPSFGPSTLNWSGGPHKRLYHQPRRPGSPAMPPPPPATGLPNGIWVRTITSPEGETTTMMQMDQPFVDFRNGVKVTTTTVKKGDEVTTTTTTALLPLARKFSGKEDETEKESEKVGATGLET